jgi:hypothetical protein
MKFFYYLFFASLLILSWSCEEKKDEIKDVQDQAVADSLKQDSIKKANQINLIGSWDISSYAGVELDEGLMVMNFSTDGKISIKTPKDTHEGTYEINQEDKIISVVEDKKPEEWLVKSYTPKQMILEAEDKEEKIDIILRKKSSNSLEDN